MELAGFEIDAYYDENGFLRLRHENKERRKILVTTNDPFPRLSGERNRTLKDLLNLIHLLTVNHLEPKKMSFHVLLEIVKQYFKLEKEKKVNEKTGRIIYRYPSKCYDFAYAIFYLMR